MTTEKSLGHNRIWITLHSALFLFLALCGCMHRHRSTSSEYPEAQNILEGAQLLTSFLVPAKTGGAFEVHLLGTRSDGTANLQNIVVSGIPPRPQIFGANSFSDLNSLSGESIDVNFDGHADFRILVALGATGNRTFHYWIFHPRKNMFEPSTELNDLGITTVNPVAKTLEGSWNSGAYCRSTHTSQYSSGRYCLISESETGLAGEIRKNPLYTELLADRDESEVVEVNKTYRKGKLTRVWVTL